MLTTSLCEVDTSISLSETSFAGFCNDLIRNPPRSHPGMLVGGCDTSGVLINLSIQPVSFVILRALLLP